MGVPDRSDDFVRLQADDLTVFVAQEIWGKLKPQQSKLLVSLQGYGRFWVHLDWTEHQSATQ